MEQFWFKSSSFHIEQNEDEETNPRIYGKQLAFWLEKKLNHVGYQETECFPEDWGWCIICHRKPFMLFVGCSNVYDYETAKEGDPPPIKDDVVWSCAIFADVPFLKRLFKKVDTTQAKTELELNIESILKAEPTIRLVEEP